MGSGTKFCRQLYQWRLQVQRECTAGYHFANSFLRRTIFLGHVTVWFLAAPFKNLWRGDWKRLVKNLLNMYGKLIKKKKKEYLKEIILYWLRSSSCNLWFSLQIFCSSSFENIYRIRSFSYHFLKHVRVIKRHLIFENLFLHIK